MSLNWSDWVRIGGSALGGGLANRGTSSTTSPTIDPAYAGLQSDLISRITQRMADPAAGTEPLRISGRAGINQLYKDAPDTISRQLNARGFGSSGKKGGALIKTELARRGELAGLDSKIAELILAREDTSMDLAMRLLGLGRGQTTSQSGNVAGGAVGPGIETLTYLDTVNKLLNAGGSSAGAAGLSAASNLGITAGAGSTVSSGMLQPGISGAAEAAGAGGGTAGAGLGLGVAGNAGVAGVGVGAAYLLSQLPTWGKDYKKELTKAYRSGQIKNGDPVLLANGQQMGGSGSAALYWVPLSDERAKQVGAPVAWGTAQQYYQATGSWPPGYKT